MARKVIKDGGRAVQSFLEYVRNTKVDSDLEEVLEENLNRLDFVTQSIVRRSQADPELPGSVSADYLELFGLVCYAWLWARMVNQAPRDEFGSAKKETARFFFHRLLQRTVFLEQSIASNSDVVMSLSDDAF